MLCRTGIGACCPFPAAFWRAEASAGAAAAVQWDRAARLQVPAWRACVPLLRARRLGCGACHRPRAWLLRAWRPLRLATCLGSCQQCCQRPGSGGGVGRGAWCELAKAGALGGWSSRAAPHKRAVGGMCAGRRLGGGMGTLPSWRATCPIPARRLPPRASVPGNKLLDVGQRTGSRDRGSVRSEGAASAGHEAWDATGRPVLRGKPTRGAVLAGCGCGRAACPTLAPAGRCCSRQFLYNCLQPNAMATALPLRCHSRQQAREAPPMPHPHTPPATGPAAAPDRVPPAPAQPKSARQSAPLPPCTLCVCAAWARPSACVTGPARGGSSQV